MIARKFQIQKMSKTERPTFAGLGLPLVELTVLSEESARLRLVAAGLDIEMLPFLSFLWLPVNKTTSSYELLINCFRRTLLRVQIDRTINASIIMQHSEVVFFPLKDDQKFFQYYLQRIKIKVVNYLFKKLPKKMKNKGSTAFPGNSM